MAAMPAIKGWKPKSKAEFQAAVVRSLQQAPEDCFKGPHGSMMLWDVSAVTDMSLTFDGWHVTNAEKFNRVISKWDVSRVTTMYRMFAGAKAFNGDLSKWDVSRVVTMDGMFSYATSFNSDISKWDVSRVLSMNTMFTGTSSFNIDISKWDVARVASMKTMFAGASSFAQTLCGAWIAFAQKTSTKGMFVRSSGRIGWASKTASTISTTVNGNAAFIKNRNPPCLTILLTETQNIELSINLEPTCDVSLSLTFFVPTLALQEYSVGCP